MKLRFILFLRRMFLLCMNFLIYGAGAVGSLVGGQLALAGYAVTFLARPHVVEAVCKDGLRIVEAANESRVLHFHITSDPADALSDPRPDLVVFTMKAYDTRAALAELQSVTSNPPPVLCLQNGVGIEAEIASALSSERVIPGIVTTAVQMPEPGRVIVERARGIGVAAGHPMSARILDALAGAGFAVREYPDPAAMKWSKLLINIVANATSAITGLSAGAIFAHPGLYGFEIEALREGVRVIRGMGLRPVDLPGVRSALLARAVFLPPVLIRPLLARVVATGRGEKMPSFYSDLERGKSEVAWLNGAIVAEGQRLGIPVPANSRLTEVLTGLVEGRYQRETFRGKPEALVAH